MALQLTKKSKGIDANYWKIIESNYNVFGNSTNLKLALYINKEARQEGLNNYLEVEQFSFEGFLTQSEMYAKIKESIIGKRVIAPAVIEGEFPNEKIVEPAVMEEYETNLFVSSIDV